MTYREIVENAINSINQRVAAHAAKWNAERAANKAIRDDFAMKVAKLFIDDVMQCLIASRNQHTDVLVIEIQQNKIPSPKNFRCLTIDVVNAMAKLIEDDGSYSVISANIESHASDASYVSYENRQIKLLISPHIGKAFRVERLYIPNFMKDEGVGVSAALARLVQEYS